MPKWFPDRKVLGSGLTGLIAFALVVLGSATGWWHIDIDTMILLLGFIIGMVGAAYQIPPSLRDRIRHLNDAVISYARALPMPQADPAQGPVQARAPPTP